MDSGLNLKAIGDRIAKHLIDEDMTRAALAEKACMPRQTVYDIINGKYPMNTDTAYKLARVLKVRIGWLLVGEEPREVCDVHMTTPSVLSKK